MVKVVYSVSNKSHLIEETLKSIETLSRFVDEKDIIVFYTPPRSEETIKKLLDVAEVMLVKNISKPYAIKKNPVRCGEKCHIGDLPYREVIFLDSDTTVNRNILELVDKGDYDFSARICWGYHLIDTKIWESMFIKRGKNPIPMVQGGFLIFKNFCHRDIASEWLGYINDPNFPEVNPCVSGQFLMKDQYALSLSVSGKRIRWMSKTEHTSTHPAIYCGKLARPYVIHGHPYRRRRKYYV